MFTTAKPLRLTHFGLIIAASIAFHLCATLAFSRVGIAVPTDAPILDLTDQPVVHVIVANADGLADRD